MLYNAWRHVIASFRRRRNLSQREAARRARVDEGTWQRWESGRVSLRPGNLERVARAVGCPPEKLAFEYSRLLHRYYCKQLGYEMPDPVRSSTAVARAPEAEEGSGLSGSHSSNRGGSVSRRTTERENPCSD